MWNRVVGLCAGLGALCLAAACATGAEDTSRGADNPWHGSVGIERTIGSGAFSCAAQSSAGHMDARVAPHNQMDAVRANAACEPSNP